MSLFDSFSKGYGLIQKRLRRVMAAEQVVADSLRGPPVDPELMTVLEVVDSAGDPPGTVAKELRRGYTWRGRVFRYAEVQAVRSGRRCPRRAITGRLTAPRRPERFRRLRLPRNR